MYISESFLSLEISLKCSKLDGKLTPIIIVWFAQAGKCSGLFCHIFLFFVCFRWYLFVFDPHDRFSSRLFRLPIAVLFYCFDD